MLVGQLRPSDAEVARTRTHQPLMTHPHLIASPAAATLADVQPDSAPARRTHNASTNGSPPIPFAGRTTPPAARTHEQPVQSYTAEARLAEDAALASEQARAEKAGGAWRRQRDQRLLDTGSGRRVPSASRTWAELRGGLESRRRRCVRAAVLEERQRIAREVHDVVAHNVSVMVVEATAAEDRFDARPEQAREALRAISASGRQALSELRQMLALVRPEDDDGAHVPRAGVGGLDPLAGSLPDVARRC